MPDDHDHPQMMLPAEAARDFSPYGLVDLRLLSHIVGAYHVGCDTCIKPLLLRIADLPATVAKLVTVAGSYLVNELGAVPAELTDVEAPGTTGRAFREVLALCTGEPGYERHVYEAVKALPRKARRVLADDTLHVASHYLTASTVDTKAVHTTSGAGSRSDYMRLVRQRALTEYEGSGSVDLAMASLLDDAIRGPDGFRFSLLQEIRAAMDTQTFDSDEQFRAFLNNLR